MEDLVQELTEVVAIVIEATAVAVIAVGSLLALVNIVRSVIVRDTKVHQRAIWLEYARWLIAGLTFQLAADIVRTTISPTWDDIGKAAAIAVIRTFLTFFLDRDIDSIRERRGREPQSKAA